MFSLLIAFSTIFLFRSVCNSEVNAEQSFEPLSERNFQEKVLDSNDAWVINFYSEEILEDFPSLSSKLATFGISSGAVNCEEKANKKVCANAGVVRMPAINLYLDRSQKNPYTNKNFRTPVPHTGQLDLKSLEKFVSKEYSKPLVKLSTSDDYEELSKNTSLNIALYLTAKSPISMNIKAVAYNFRETGLIVTYSSLASLAEMVNASSLPWFGVIANGTVHQYSGDLKNRLSIIEWTTTFVPVSTVPIADEPKVPENIVLTSPSKFTTDVMNKTHLAWIVAVKGIDQDEDSEISINTAISTVSAKCEGAIRLAVLNCGDTSTVDTTVVEDTSSLASLLCAKKVASYFVVIPHGAFPRKKVNSTLAKWSYLTSDSESAVKRAGETLPEATVGVIPEKYIRDWLARGLDKGMVSILALSEKDKESGPPVMLRNLAITMGSIKGLEEEEDLGLGLAQIGIMYQPPKAFLMDIAGGRIQLPALLAFLEVEVDRDLEQQAQELENVPEDEKKKTQIKSQVQVMIFDRVSYGPLKLSSAKMFSLNAFRTARIPVPKRARHLFPEPVEDTKAKETESSETSSDVTEEEEEPAPEVVPADSETEAMMAEIVKEEKEKAARVKAEAEAEAKRIKEEMKKDEAAETKKRRKKSKKGGKSGAEL